MKIVLKNEKSYPIKSVNRSVVTDLKKSAYVEKAPKENPVSAYIANILLQIPESGIFNLFELIKDFSIENISELKFENGLNQILTEGYDVVYSISQNISEYVNETTIVLVKYNY